MARARIICVVGTRPDAVKLAPVILALNRHPRLQPFVLATGQHREMLDAALGDFGLAPDLDLALMQPGQSPAALLGAALAPLAEAFTRLAPAAVVVQGDTTTAVAGAHAAFLAQRPLAHVEAGLRTGDRRAPFPEEGNRRLIAQLADVHFAPTAAARTALRRERVDAAAIHLTGNTGIDALRLIDRRLQNEPALRVAAAAAVPGLDPARPLLLVTAHRRESHGAPLAAIAEALAQLADDGFEIVLPVHPHPAVESVFRARLGGVARIHLVPPLAYPAFVWLLGRAAAVLTDSGGVQEEGPALGVPVLVLRDVTERGEGVASGNARLVGTATTAIVAAVRALIADGAMRARMAEPALPYGDGEAAPRIVATLDRLYASARADAEFAHQL